ncbi:MAG: YhdP family protein [Gallionella sp.]
MLNSLPVRLLWHSLNWLTRITIITLAISSVVCALTIIVFRYWLLPDIEQFHNKITTSLSNAIGNPVSIGKIEGNWNGLHPHLNFTDVRILDSRGLPALVLPHIDASLSWLSLLTAELRLNSLEIDQPIILVRRNNQGQIFIGSVPLATGGTNNNLSDWILHQSRIVVRKAIIIWLDEQRDAPPLVLKQVNLRIENLFSHHQFSLRAVPPDKVSTPLDVRGDFYGTQFNKPASWHGQAFAQLDHTDILAWRPWINFPPQLSRGRGALRGWLGIENGKISKLTVDMALRDVATQLTGDVPEMDVHYLHGRTTWKTLPDGWEVTTHHLSMRLHNGVHLQPTDFYFRTIQASPSHPASGELHANLLQLESLVSLSNFFPLDAELRTQVLAYAPRGKVLNLDMRWQGTPKKLTDYEIKGQFQNLAMLQVGTQPGFSGLTLSVNGSQKSGYLNINTHDLTLNAPGIMREPLSFHTLTGQLKWQRKKGEIAVTADNISISNDDLAGNLYGSYHSKSGTLGIADLTINLTRGEIKQAARYTPLIVLSPKDNDYLNSALLSGHTEDFHLRLKGNLSDFPLNGTTESLFEITAHAQDAAMKFAPDWPKLENMTGDFLIHNNKMQIHASSSSILGAKIQNLSIIQPDMSMPDTPLQIKGEVDASNNIFLQFIQQSPVRSYIKGFTDGIQASGKGHLDLSAQIPLLMTKPAKISGLFRLQDSDINLGNGVPWLRNTRGELSFTESNMQTHNVSATILGGIAQLEVQTFKGGEVRATIQGHTDLDALHTKNPLLAQLHGKTAWNANISIINKQAHLILQSNLLGISSRLPAPFNKRADEQWPLRVEKKNRAYHQDLITAQLDKQFSARLISHEERGTNTIERGVIHFGKHHNDTSKPLKKGLWLTGNLPILSLQGWGGFSTSTGPSLAIAGVHLHIDKLTGYGASFNNLEIRTKQEGNNIHAQLTSTQLNGQIVWQPHGYKNSAKVTARLHNLYWLKEAAPTTKTVKSSKMASHPSDLPALDISIENFQLKGKKMGRFELVGYPEGQDWRLRRLHITNPDGRITGDGLWHEDKDKMNTQVKLLLKISNAGEILARSGYPNTVKNGTGELIAKLNWDGSPDAFNYATLGGTLKLDTGKGQFLKMDPGIGKLLGILSLQALPKRITLDFTDVFSSGFEFDNINGDATITQGIIQTKNLHIEGSAAKVTMQGQINLNNETQNMHIVILPALGSSVSMLSAFAAGPWVGIGTLIVSKVLGNPLDNLMSFEYNVTGKWDKPDIVKVGEKPVKKLDTPKKP